MSEFLLDNFNLRPEQQLALVRAMQKISHAKYEDGSKMTAPCMRNIAAKALLDAGLLPSAMPRKPPKRAPVAGTLEVGTSPDRKEIIVNHPDLKPDAAGVGHIVFSPDQARALARTLYSKAHECDGAIK